jgi:hypothetical protein
MYTAIPKPTASWARVSCRRRYTVTLTGDDEQGDPLDQGMRQVECRRIGNQQGSCADELRRRTPPSTAQELCLLRTPASSPDQWPC